MGCGASQEAQQVTLPDPLPAKAAPRAAAPAALKTTLANTAPAPAAAPAALIATSTNEAPAPAAAPAVLKAAPENAAPAPAPLPAAPEMSMPCTSVVAGFTGYRGYRGPVLHFIGDPVTKEPEKNYEYFEDGLLVVLRGKVVACKDAVEAIKELGDDLELVDCSDKLIMPGFVDCHVHYPQIDIVGSYGEQLLEWLQNYVFPAEAQYKDVDYANKVAKIFCNELLKSGTTTALTFCTVHKESVDALFTAAQERNMLMIAGKVLMDNEKFVPDFLREDCQQSYEESKALIAKWHTNGRCLYAVTPRFAVSSTPEELELAGKLCAEHAQEGVYMHTHLNENNSEIALAKEIHDCDSYLGIYHKHGLTGPKSVFAHCVHMEDAEWDCMKETKSAMAFCPTSNLFLGSGFVDLQAVHDRGIRCGLGTDIGAGTSFCQLKTLNEAYKVGQMRKFKMSSLAQYHLATLASAGALSLDHRIGNFLPGKEADFVVLDLCATPLMERRIAQCKTLEEKLFVLSTLGDDRCVAATYVMGVQQYQRAAVKGSAE